jgi:hypothetical protein
MRDCCLFVRSNTTPPGPPTGYAHPACFARDLGDCSSKISREHYISESVLGLFGGEGITVSGLPGQPGLPWLAHAEEKEVSLASLTAKMLCERHNQALSALDATAANFFRFLTAKWSEDAIEVYLVRGYDLERWFLKMLCGLVASGMVTVNGHRLSKWTPPAEWLEILFGSADVEAPAGLHSIVAERYHFATESFMVHLVFSTDTAQPAALVFAAEGIAFLFAMVALPPKRQPSEFGSDTRYRPGALQLNESCQIREAHFGWPDGRLVRVKIGA